MLDSAAGPVISGRAPGKWQLPAAGNLTPVRALGRAECERSRCVRKQDLIREVASGANLSEAQATRAVNAFLDAIQNSLASNDEVQLSGFGSFRVVERAAREGRNPRTGAPMQIGARRSPTFKPGTQLKRSVEAG
jgi:DNA-binding protein HU-beta